MNNIPFNIGIMLKVLSLSLLMFAHQGMAANTVKLEFGNKDQNTELRLSIGKSQIIQSQSALEQVVIGSPEIADIKLLSSRQVLILGIKPGRTNLVFRDKKKNLVAVMDVVVGYDLNGIKKKLATLLPSEEGISVIGSNHSVILSGQVESLMAMDKAVNVATSYVPKESVVNLLEIAGGQQVMLEVHIAEVSRRSFRELGSQLAFSDAAGNTVNFASGSALSEAFSSLTIGRIWGQGTKSLTGTIQALEEQGLAKTLAEPNLVTMSGQEASFLAGGEIPIPVAQSSGGNSGPIITLEFKEFGIGLRFTPTVLSDDKINIKLATEVSAINNSETYDLGAVKVPAISTRRASTTVEMGDGQSFAIAGLMANDMNNVVKKVPFLGSIPIIGALFSSTEYQRRESELVVIVTPKLVKPVDMGQLSLPTDNIIAPTALDQYLFGNLEHIYYATNHSNDKENTGLEGEYGHSLEEEVEDVK
ncbi:MAG: type II and III secretion system protein family protein [Sinobacterium sp.]|nr:type II and III secretion system protein family protein [Sinobacterium sp.]